MLKSIWFNVKQISYFESDFWPSPKGKEKVAKHLEILLLPLFKKRPSSPF
jgi:hypothetical protein